MPLDAKRDSARVSEYYIIIPIDDNIRWCYAIYETVSNGFRSGICQTGLLANSIQLCSHAPGSNSVFRGAKKFSKELYQSVLICPHLLRASPLR